MTTLIPYRYRHRCLGLTGHRRLLLLSTEIENRKEKKGHGHGHNTITRVCAIPGALVVLLGLRTVRTTYI